MATPTIPNGEEYFFPIIYEGNGAGQRVGRFVPFTDNGTIDNSCIFNDGDSAYLSRTPSSNGNAKTFTFSCWFKPCALGASKDLFGNAASGNAASLFYIMHYSTSTIYVQGNDSGSNLDLSVQTNMTLEDTSKFYHIMVVVDTTQSTDSDRVKIYIDGDLQTSLATTNYPSLNAEFGTSQTSRPMVIGRYNYNGTRYLDGYMAEVNFVDGSALTPSTFGVTDTSTGRWIPKTLSGITYGTNGFRLKFQDSSALGDDTSGNGNDLASTNLASTDQTTDSPTQNHAVLASNPTAGTATLSEGNLKIAGTGSSVYGVRRATFLINSNDSNGYYFEAKNVGSSTDNINIGLISSQNALSASAYGGSNSYGIASRGSGGSNQYWRVLGGSTDVTTSVSHASDDVIGVAIKEGKIWFAINNTYVLSGDPAAGTNAFFDMSSQASQFQIAFNVFQNNTLDVNFGQKSLAYSAPTGFSTLQQDNLPTTDKGVSGLVWAKSRDNTGATLPHQLVDSSRGVGNRLIPNDSVVEAFNSNHLTKFLKGGYATGDINVLNTAGDSMVAWNWVANSGSTSSNEDGSITSTVQVNTTAGFSIVQYTGTGSNATVGHGLSSAPEWMIIKRRDGATTSWAVYHVGQTNLSGALYLNLSNAVVSSYNFWNSTAPTSSVFSIGTQSQTNHSSANMIAYCWHSVEGYSKFGSYEGNANAEGPFVYLGFRPAFLMIKNIDRSVDWIMIDSKRDPFNNDVSKLLKPSSSDAESEANNKGIDLLSNGFKIRQASSNAFNASSETHVYMAFAEHPFVGDGTSPVTAR